VIGVRKEDKNPWERRAPLTPSHVAGLASDGGIDIVVQPSDRRVFPAADYTASGARMDDDLDGCGVVLGIKEIPIAKLERDKAYVFFSHTTKGQPYNMPLLQALLDQRCTLIDYEMIADDQGRRLIFFGRHAGCAGMIDGLWALGQRLEKDGVANPFTEIRPAHAYDSLDEAEQAIARVGERIRNEGVPDGLHPMICGFTGTGNVSTGAIEVYDKLPVREVRAEELEGLDETAARNVVYKVVFDVQDRYTHKHGKTVTFEEVVAHPENLDNGMMRWLDKITVLVNGMFWSAALPYLLTLDDMKTGWRSGALKKLKLIADISCDIDGAIEATVKATTPDNPVYVYDVEKETVIDGFVGEGPVILAVDNLPAELPREASYEFGDALTPFVPQLDRCDWSRPFDELDLPPELSRAIITHRGDLAPRFKYLEEHLREKR